MVLLSKLDFIPYDFSRIKFQTWLEDILRTLGVRLDLLVSAHVTNQRSSNKVPVRPQDISAESVFKVCQTYIMGDFFIDYLPYIITVFTRAEGYDPKAMPRHRFGYVRYFLAIMANMVLNIPNANPATSNTSSHLWQVFPSSYNNQSQSGVSGTVDEFVMYLYRALEKFLRTKILHRIMMNMQTTAHYLPSRTITQMILIDFPDVIEVFVEVFHGYMIPAGLAIIYGADVSINFNWTDLFVQCVALIQRTITYERTINPNHACLGLNNALHHIQQIWMTSTRENLSNVLLQIHDNFKRDQNQLQTEIMAMLTNSNVKNDLMEWVLLHSDEYRRLRNILMRSLYDNYRQRYMSVSYEFANAYFANTGSNLNKGSVEKDGKLSSNLDAQSGLPQSANIMYSVPNTAYGIPANTPATNMVPYGTTSGYFPTVQQPQQQHPLPMNSVIQQPQQQSGQIQPMQPNYYNVPQMYGPPLNVAAVPTQPMTMNPNPVQYGYQQPQQGQMQMGQPPMHQSNPYATLNTTPVIGQQYGAPMMQQQPMAAQGQQTSYYPQMQPMMANPGRM